MNTPRCTHPIHCVFLPIHASYTTVNGSKNSPVKREAAPQQVAVYVLHLKEYEGAVCRPHQRKQCRSVLHNPAHPAQIASIPLGIHNPYLLDQTIGDSHRGGHATNHRCPDAERLSRLHPEITLKETLLFHKKSTILYVSLSKLTFLLNIFHSQGMGNR